MSDGEIREHLTSDNVRLRFRHWRAERPRGIVIGLHGIQSHSGWYKFSSRRIAESGLDVVFADRRGSGRNGLNRGHAPHGMRLINDVRALAAQVRAEHIAASGRQLPIVLMGISWGGKIAAAAASLFPDEFAGLILLTPGLAPQFGPSWWQRHKLNLARRWQITRRDIPIPLRDPKLFTDVAQWQDFIADDPLTLHTVTSDFLNAGRDLDAVVRARGRDVCRPTLLMLAGRDRIIDNPQTLKIVQSFGTDRLTTVMHPSACHTLEFDAGRDRIVEDLIHWLSWTVPSAQAQPELTIHALPQSGPRTVVAPAVAHG